MKDKRKDYSTVDKSSLVNQFCKIGSDYLLCENTGAIALVLYQVLWQAGKLADNVVLYEEIFKYHEPR